MVRDKKIESDELVVCLVSGSGLKDIGSVQKAAGEPRVIDSSIDAVREALH
jgi:threonine synthase